MSLRLIFMGTPEFSVPVLESLFDAGHEVCAVYSQPPSRSGRGMKLRHSAVHAAAEKKGIPVFVPESFKDTKIQKTFSALNADAAIVVAYGLILPQIVLDAPKYGCFNVHASLLPRWRGAAPIQRAIMAGDKKSGVTIMAMEAGLDSGPMCLSAETEITEMTTGQQLHDSLSELGARLMVQALEKLQAGTLDQLPQSDEGVTYAKKIEKAETRINFNQSANMVIRQIHGLSPFPGSWLEIPHVNSPIRVKILRASIGEQCGAVGEIIDDSFAIACATGTIKPLELQRSGKPVLELVDFLNGVTINPGIRV